MAMIICKSCKGRTPEHDTLGGYCMLCANQRIGWEAKLRVENKKLKKRSKEFEAEKEKLAKTLLSIDNYCRVNDIDLEQVLKGCK